jgi:hypothetical protein
MEEAEHNSTGRHIQQGYLLRGTWLLLQVHLPQRVEVQGQVSGDRREFQGGLLR